MATPRPHLTAQKDVPRSESLRSHHLRTHRVRGGLRRLGHLAWVALLAPDIPGEWEPDPFWWLDSDVG